MSYRFDLKTLPELAALPVERRVQIERRSLFLAAWDWRTLLIPPLAIGGFYLAARLAPDEGSNLTLWLIGWGILSLFCYLLMIHVRAHHYAFRLAAECKAEAEGDQGINQVGAPAFPKRVPLSTSRKGVACLVFWLSVPFLYFGIADQQWMWATPGLGLLAGSLALVTGVAVCPGCKNVNIQVGAKHLGCPTCGTVFAKEARPLIGGRTRWICLVALASFLACWGYDRAVMILWIGSTDLEVEFVVLDAETGDPVEGATIAIRSYEPRYLDGEGKDFSLVTDRHGIARQVCPEKTSTGAQSGLGFTNTYSVYPLAWSVKVSAPGFAASEGIHLEDRTFRPPVERIGPQMARMRVQVELHRPSH